MKYRTHKRKNLKNTPSTTNWYHHIHISQTNLNARFISYHQSIIPYCTMGTDYTSSHEFEYVTSFTIKSKNISVYLDFWQL